MILINGDITFEEGEGQNFESWQWTLKAKTITGFLDWSYKPFFNRRKENGEICELSTSELGFSLQSPIEMEPQLSYDGSINLILNDDKNPPRLINSRFTVRDNNTFERVDRLGENDTNIYDDGKFQLQTSLQKLYTTIPEIQFNGEQMLGHLKVGTYIFYFAYCDADDNETDIVAESGIVPMFKGETPQSVDGGSSDQDSNKSVSFTLKNIDSEYGYVKIYYVRYSAAINQQKTPNVYKIFQKYQVKNNQCDILITGIEANSEIAEEDLNIQYSNISSSKTQAIIQNRLFLGNIKKIDPLYNDLRDISLRILPTYEKHNKDELIGELNYRYQDYTLIKNNLEYYNPVNIYNYVGYEPGEIYKLGIVYIMKDNSLSPVYDIRGKREIPEFGSNKESESKLYDYTHEDIFKYGENEKREAETDYSGTKIVENIESLTRNYITCIDETTKEFTGTSDNENAKGTILIKDQDDSNLYVYSLRFVTTSAVLQYLKTKVKGFFFVRQKRMQTKLGQALLLPIERQSSLPMIPNKENNYVVEGFMDKDRIITHEYSDRLINITANRNQHQGCLIFPEYELNQPYYNTIFTGQEFKIKYSKCNNATNYLSVDETNERHYYLNRNIKNNDDNFINVKLIQVGDNMKLSGIDDYKFAARAGEAEEGFRYSKIDSSAEQQKAYNYARGSYGPYVGLTSKQNLEFGKIVDVYIPGYNQNDYNNYFKIRYQDQSNYSAISDRCNFTDMEDFNKDIYRGDSYICNFTHRLNRNFSDPTTPVDDKIIDSKTWKDNFKVSDGVVQKEKFTDINLGDINAVRMGSWITFKVRCSRNISLRSSDGSNVSEKILYGHQRSFYPLAPMSPNATYKIPDSFVFNDALSVSVGIKSYFTLPDAPYFKDKFPTRIYYSDIYINDAYVNGYRRFINKNYRDYESKYGGIVKLIPYERNLICVFEHGITLLAINQQTPISQRLSEPVFINTNSVLPENMAVISDSVGSQWADSVIKTQVNVYGVDTHAKRIWRFGPKGLEYLSDFRIQHFLNENITLTENKTNVFLGVRNIKTHYNKNKGDVIFTYYDDLNGFEEKAWSICYNEKQQIWTTFYSWIPSFSTNIYNNFFTFDRDTQKYISKLGTCVGNDQCGIIVKEPQVKFDNNGNYLFYLDVNFNSENSGINVGKQFNIENDIYGFYKYIEPHETMLNCFVITQKNYEKIKEIMYAYNLPVILINTKCNITVTTSVESLENQKQQIQQYINSNYKQFQKQIVLLPDNTYPDKDHEGNKLQTWFWSHGKTGIFDIKEEIKPTNWYGKQFPFEFEFIVNDNIQLHKIFDNLQIISNNAEPESFHYEITGDCYDFAFDKQNMFIRQEATKEALQNNNINISFDESYKDFEEHHYESEDGGYRKSTIFPQYYFRQDEINKIDDKYVLLKRDNERFDNMTGAEITIDDRTNTFKIQNHVPAINLSEGRLRGNMQYKENKWYVQINPLYIRQKNEEEWSDNKIPIEVGASIIPEVLNNASIDEAMEKYEPKDNRSMISWGNDYEESSCKIKDKYMKVKIRYSGKKLAIINAVYTAYSISVS